MEADRQEQAKQYAKQNRWCFILDFFINGALAISWVISGLAILLNNLFHILQMPLIFANALFIICYGFIAFIVDSPLTFYSDYVLPKRYKLSTENLSSWLLDQIKSLAISGAIGVPLLLLIYWFLSVTPDNWWIWAAAILILFSVLFANLYPVLIAPIFNKFTPLSEEYAALEQKLIALAEKVGTKITGVYKYDMSRRTSAANAALMGLSNTKRIVLSDTILENFSDDEIETIIAHELGHYVHRDLPLSILVNSVIIILTFYAASFGMRWSIDFFNFNAISDISTLPLLEIMFGIFSLVVFPVQNTFSRILETRADEYSLKNTNKPEAFASALNKLSDQNLAEQDPDPLIEFFMHSHPAISRRIKMAEEYSEKINA